MDHLSDECPPYELELPDDSPPYQGDLTLDSPPYHPKKTWNQWTLDYDEISDERREELNRFGAQCREKLDRLRNNPSAQWPPDNYVDSSDTDDGSRTPTGLLTPEPEAPVATRPFPSNPLHLNACELNQPPYPVLSAAEYAAKCAASIEAGLDEAMSGPVENRPVVDFQDNTKRYGVSPGLWHDLWGTRHNTRFEKRRRSYLFALNDAGQPAVVTAGNDDSTFSLYNPESLAIEKYEKLKDAGLVTFSEESFLDFIMDYLESPELKRITRGSKRLRPETEAFYLDRRKLRDAQTLGKGKGHNAQRIEKRGRRPRGKKRPRR